MPKHEPLKVVVTFCTVFLLFGLWMYFGKEREWAQWMIFAAIGIQTLSLISPAFAKLAANAWMTFGKGLGWINSRIILSVVYILVLTPVAFLYRIFSGDKMQLKKTEGASYFKDRSKSYEPSDFEKPW